MIKKWLHISLAIILSAVISIETIGLYIIKDTCAPCGSSSLDVELVKVSVHNHDISDEGHCCSADYTHKSCCDTEEHEQSCCTSTTLCHTDEHQHHQVDFYLKHEPDFYQRIDHFSFSAPTFAVLTTLLEVNSNIFEKANTIPLESPPLPSALDGYQAILCTFLI